MTFFSPASFIFRTLSNSRVWTKGPFFRLLLIFPTLSCQRRLLRPLLLAATDDHAAAGLLLVASTVALGGNAPRGDRVAAGGLVLALAAAVRVVDRVHRGTTDGRADTGPPVAAGLADRDAL